MGIIMISAAVLSDVMTPKIQPGIKPDKFNLETMIPREFKHWKIDTSTVDPIVNPATQVALGKIYSQTLTRTYINDKGERVMLSIAYGGNQSTDLHVHRPEICYTSAGFDISKMDKTFIDTTIGRIPVMHLVATHGTRNEPITYWIRVGDTITRGWVEQKLTAINYSLSGKVPDGLLFRISTISNDEQDSYRIQQDFLATLLQAVQTKDLHWLVGKPVP
jgi:EpsI family protein